MTTANDTPLNKIPTEEEVKEKLEHITKCASIIFMTATELCKQDASILLSILTAALGRSIIEVVTHGMSSENFQTFLTEFLDKVKENITGAHAEMANIQKITNSSIQEESTPKVEDSLVKA